MGCGAAPSTRDECGQPHCASDSLSPACSNLTTPALATVGSRISPTDARAPARRTCDLLGPQAACCCQRRRVAPLGLCMAAAGLTGVTSHFDCLP